MMGISFCFADERLLEFVGNQRLSSQVISDFDVLRAAATAQGFNIQPVSGYRSVERQLCIWNEKATGKRPIVDDAGHVLDPMQMSQKDCLFAILRFSALPGASRHHWGSDMDVIDVNAMPSGYKLQLSSQETQGEGIFAPMHRWLDDYLLGDQVPFFRPYQSTSESLLKVAMEPWHLSYAPLAMPCQKALDRDELKSFVAALDIELKECVLQNWDYIYDHYIWVPWSHYAGKNQA